MNMSKWRLGFYCFCLTALGLASNAAYSVQQSHTLTSRVLLPKKVVSRAIASETKVAIDRAAEEEILVVTPFGIIYKRTRYVESIRMHIKDNRELLSKIKAKDAEIKKKTQEIETLKGQNDVAKSIIALAVKDIQDLDKDRKRLQGELSAVQRRHAQEKKSLETDIASLKEQLSSEQAGKASEKKLKEDALVQLEIAKSEFTSLKGELEQTSGELILAEDEIARLEIVTAALSDDLEAKKVKIAEQETTISEQGSKLSSQETTISEQGTKITEQETTISEQGSKLTEQQTKIADQGTKISEQSIYLEDLKVAECKQKEQLNELKKQVETFETEKSEMDEVIAALKLEKEETAKQRKIEKAQIAALLQRFSMYATLATQQPQPQMPQVMHNPLTNSSMVDWNQYMMLAMVGNMSRTGAMNPFDFNGGNSEVNSYYYLPKQATDSYLYNSALNPTGTSWGSIGPDNYFGNVGGGFDFRQGGGHMSALQPNRGPAYFQY